MGFWASQQSLRSGRLDRHKILGVFILMGERSMDGLRSLRDLMENWFGHNVSLDEFTVADLTSG